jgi:hypothetical protein
LIEKGEVERLLLAVAVNSHDHPPWIRILCIQEYYHYGSYDALGAMIELLREWWMGALAKRCLGQRGTKKRDVERMEK